MHDNRIRPMSDWGSSGRRFNSCQPDFSTSRNAIVRFAEGVQNPLGWRGGRQRRFKREPMPTLSPTEASGKHTSRAQVPGGWRGSSTVFASPQSRGCLFGSGHESPFCANAYGPQWDTWPTLTGMAGLTVWSTTQRRAQPMTYAL